MIKVRKNNSKKALIEWFEVVCEGIRSEYERGASCRKLEIDIKTLEKLFNDNKKLKISND